MERVWKEALEYAFEAPKPRRKRVFVREFGQWEMSLPAFLISQACYIRKRAWGFSAGVFAAAWAGAAVYSADMLWSISALAPMLALAVISESGRSEMHEMAELEMATRFSLRSVMLARLGFLGAGNLAVLFLMMPLGVWNHQLSLFKAGVYILAPFLLTALTGLHIVRRVRGRGALYACAGAAMLISVLAFCSHNLYPQLYESGCFGRWIAGVLALGAGTAGECRKMIEGMEELAWN